MSKKLSLNSGIETYEIDNGTVSGAVLRVNFSDTNLYFRFIEMQKSLEEIEKDFNIKTADFKSKVDEKGFPIADENAGRETLSLMHEFDTKIKDKLTEVFGPDNDFDNIFAGVNVMSLDEKGNSIISNFLEMITPVIKKAMDILKKSDDEAVKALVGNRAERRARNDK